MVEAAPAAAASQPSMGGTRSGEGDRLAGLGQQVGGEPQRPVDIERGRHVGLHLGDHARHRQRHDIAGALVIETHRFDALGPQMHAGRADHRAGGPVVAGIDPAPSAVITMST